MSSRPPHRGRGRGFAGRSYSAGRGQFVSGDAHFWSVRDANLGFRRGERGSFANQTLHHQTPPYDPRPPHPPLYHQNPQFRHPPPQFRPSPPSVHRQAFRPPQHLRPRPPDYRNWELAPTPPPPPHCERFIVLSYNILADYLALDHRNKLYFHIPHYMLDWQWRKRNIIFELGLWSADVMCLQEVDRFHELVEELKLKGYHGIWKMRTGNPVDGCAIFWRTSRFNLLYEECIEFNKLGLRDNVAQICVLELINQNGSVPPSLTGSSKVVICNIHVLYNPNRGEIKLGQVRVLLDKAEAVSKLWNNAPVVICGDFNCTPKSPLYNFISEQKLDLSEIDRDKVSGQASAIIRAPRFYDRNSSERSATGSVQAAFTEGDKEFNIEQDNSLLDMQNPDPKSDNSDNQYTQAVLDISDKSGTNVQCGKERDAYAGKDTQETAAVDHSKIFGEVDCVQEERNPSYSDGREATDHINGEVHDITPMTSSALEAVHIDTTGMGSTEHLSDAVSTSNQELLSKKSNLHVPEGNKHIEFDCSPTSLQEDDQTSRVKIDLESTDLLNIEISSTKPSDQTSISSAFDFPHPRYIESPACEVSTDDQMNTSSTSHVIDESHQSTNIDFPLDEKLEKSSLDETDKAIIGSENIGEDVNSFISALHNAEGVTLDLGPSMKSDHEKPYQFEELNFASNKLLPPAESSEVEDDLSPSPTSKSVDLEETTYNPSLWTPMEIETATGNAERTFLEHPLLLRSTYTEAMDCSGTRDPYGEPLVTSYNRCFFGTVDYIWRSNGLQTTRVLAPIPRHAMEWTPGFPTKKWGSDHIALVSELAFLKDGTDISKDV
ncbi:carbon catabolite repressor protein 4 homolog 6-like [Gastrolobium bilobum]|uniref:carbon catabolite repressor protein 4 homolog 6-like n=1 Tax=Gastrolobium bilobum TaxID=150636 RepID=UPI002AB27A10|nr:carbon catabolite repressor protein 4 homolog 6-like [Gastrolobium bilobum]